MQSLERQGLVVILATIPPSLYNGELQSFNRNACIRLIAGSTRPLLDFETRWFAAGAAAAGSWYADDVHASIAGQVVEAEMATTILLGLMK